MNHISHLWDTHMHSQFSGDSQTPQEDMILSAVQKGLSGICFTDHLDIDYPNEPDLFLLDLPAYVSSVQSLREKYKETISVCLGIELGLQPHLASVHAAILKQYPFDFVIGSSHVVHGIDPYYREYYAGRGDKEAYREYFESILENIRAFDGFDVYGHIDYVVRYGPTKNKYYSWTQYQDVINEILTLLIQKGKGIELNMGGFLNGLNHPNPDEEILARYRELGGEIITIGADAHKTEHVAYAYEKATALLQAAGFRYFTIFKKRTPEFVALE